MSFYHNQNIFRANKILRLIVKEFTTSTSMIARINIKSCRLRHDKTRVVGLVVGEATDLVFNAVDLR
jgi:hypothetical protein